MSRLLTIEYDPRSGTVVPDLEVLPYAQRIVASFNTGHKSVEIRVGSELLITAFRVLAKRKIIGSQELCVKLGSEIIPIDADGNFKSFSAKYPNVSCDLLLELI